MKTANNISVPQAGTIKSSNQDGNKQLDKIKADRTAAGTYDDTDYQYDNSHINLNPDGKKFQMSEFKIPDGLRCGQIAREVAQANMHQVSGNGTATMYKQQKEKGQRSLTDMQINGSGDDPEDNLPIGPGYAMMTHLFKRSGGKGAIQAAKKDKLLNGANIITNAMDGVKTALQMIGCYSETNSGGLPIDLKDAMKVYFGKKEPSDVEKSQFNHDLQDGAHKVDKKKVRKFVNQDGSLTWEIMNDDKTVMSRFTYGDYNGAKIFAQGGYNKFAELLDKAKKELGPDNRAEFDAIRNGFGKR